MKVPFQLEGVLLLAAALLAGCGGGGGDPGTCHGSPEVCAEGGSSPTGSTGTSQTTGTTQTTGATQTTGTTTGTTGAIPDNTMGGGGGY